MGKSVSKITRLKLANKIKYWLDKYSIKSLYPKSYQTYLIYGDYGIKHKKFYYKKYSRPIIDIKFRFRYVHNKRN